ncbi:MAG: DNA-binding transcriptional regulator [Pirellulales bacterium]|nr:DNA-binding transcriptional regulator [Pirellulales bacterium]
MTNRLRIALLIGASRQYRRDLLCGIAEYSRVHGPWTFYHEEQIGDDVPAWLPSWRGDGILARIESPRQVEAIRAKGFPTVDLLGRHELEGIPAFDNDTKVVARLGAEHLIERGFQHFAFCGLEGIHYSERSGADFVEYLHGRGFEVSVYGDGRPIEPVAAATAENREMMREDALADWIEDLPKPLGLMACNDLRAQQVLNACGKRGILVPDDVAVLGADNDEVLCGLSNPPLSSIDPNARKMGYQAAALLERMIAGKPAPEEKILIEPAGVVTRRSTDVLAIADRHVATALKFIREHACDNISVDDVLATVHLSRSTLERRFLKYLGRSPKAEILHIQLQRIKQFLAETDYPLARIAGLVGFSHVENMCNFFKAKMEETPGQYRKRIRVPRQPGLD